MLPEESNEAFTGFGVELGVINNGLDRKNSGAAAFSLKNVSLPRGCVDACLSSDRCTFFSHGAELDAATSKIVNVCRFCSSCELTAAGELGHTSWARAPRTGSRYRRFGGSVLAPLAPWLAADYSVKLYGGGRRTPNVTDGLRVIYLDLLDLEAVRLLAQVGVCEFEGKPPLQPLYAKQDLFKTPINTVWIHPETAPQPIADHGWVEVTHCPVNLESERRSLRFLAWKHTPLWAYAAAGSGVSMNVGRTLVLRSYSEAERLLTALFPGYLSGGATCAAANVSHRHCQRPDGSPPRLHCRPQGLSWMAQYGAAAVNLEAKLDFAEVDSLQILEHKEYFSREPRHEIVFLRHRECEPLSHDHPNVRCGRAPQLRPCPPADDSQSPLWRMANCNNHPAQPWYDGAVRRKLRSRSGLGNPKLLEARLKLSRFRPDSPCSSSPCFRGGPNRASGWFCPSGGEPTRLVQAGASTPRGSQIR